MNRRDLFRAALAGAVSSCLRWLPMPEAPRASGMAPVRIEDPISEILKKYYLPAVRDLLNTPISMRILGRAQPDPDGPSITLNLPKRRWDLHDPT